MGKPFLSSIADRIRPGSKADADANAPGRDLEKGVDDDPDPDGIRNESRVNNSNVKGFVKSHDGASVAAVVGTANHDVVEKKKDNIIMDDNTVKNTSSPATESSTVERRDGRAGTLPWSTRFRKATIRFGKHSKNALFHSYVNILLIFVPIGIAVRAANLNAALVFAMNAVAIIPLAGLLTHATESVAVRLGDTLGALLNVSFGNAVELIIFIIALVKNEIRIVQASVLGSILANLLLILGMAFLFGGLRYREQLYNNIVTQMSACLLSLSVISFLLPTAFHASFNDTSIADAKTLEVSRGASVILLLVYIIYLTFQLKSHAYLYQSTPQTLIDEESHPGVLADVFDSSSSSSSSSDDSDTTDGSHTTMKRRIKRAIRRRRRKSSSNSEETRSVPSHLSSPAPELANPEPTPRPHTFNDPVLARRETTREDYFDGVPRVRDFELGASNSRSPDHGSVIDTESLDLNRRLDRRDMTDSKKRTQKKRNSKRAVRKYMSAPEPEPEPGRVTFEEPEEMEPRPPLTPNTTFKRHGSSWRPGLPKLLSQNVFIDPPPPRGDQRPKLNKASSLPDLNRARIIVPGRGLRASRLKAPPPPVALDPESEDEMNEPLEMSRTAAVVMLLVSTGLVALCAEFLVDAIPAMTASSSISSEFIGLIILPIVGNAAEHVTAVTVAMKNKMDLAIGVAVGSSIQIALFVTPLVVILGWMTNHAMSLYFTLFETISLFVTTFVVNFLVLDGKSNYLEGTLLIASYILIALSAYFFPNASGANSLGGG